jgi:hypothetical protein
MGWGDELMAAGEVSKIYAGEPVAILESLNGAPRTHDAWANNIQILQRGHIYRHSIINGPGNRPYGFYDGERWQFKKYKPTPAPMYFSQDEYDFASTLPEGFIVLEPHSKEKKEIVNRDWGWHKWVTLAALLRGEFLVQLSIKGLPVLPGVQHIPVPSPRHLAIALTKARAFVSIEGGFHHTAASARLPGVVIYGHFNSPYSLGYDFHRHLFSGDIGCGSQVQCQKCKDYMEGLLPQQVADELQTILMKENDHSKRQPTLTPDK